MTLGVRAPVVPERSARGRYRRVCWAVYTVAVLTLVGLYSLQPDGVGRDVTYLFATCGAAVIAWLGTRRHHGAARLPWCWISVGLTLSFGGDLVARVGWQGVFPDTSVADLLWLPAYVAIVIGLFELLKVHRDGKDRDGALDMAAVGILTLLLLWQFSVEGIVTDASTPGWVRAVWAAYPVCDALLFAVVVRTMLARRASSTAGGLLALGAACWFLSDIAYVAVADAPNYVALSRWLDVGWIIGAATMGAAAWTRGHKAAATTGSPRRVGLRQVALTVLPLLTPALIEVWSHARGRDADPVPLLVAMAALVAVTYVRVVGLMRSSEAARARLVSSERYYRALAANSSDAVVVIDPDGAIREDSPTTAALTGSSARLLRGVNVFDLMSAQDVAGARTLVDGAMAAPGEVLGGEFRVLHSDGTDLWVSVRAVNLTDEPDVGGVVVNLHDITARKTAQAEIAHRAFHDSLTGLANRALFHNRVEHAINRASRSGIDVAVLFLDLDGFKNVNDSLGHAVGDTLLREIATRLLGAVRPGDTVARLGGDEFAVLIEHAVLPEVESAVVADRILHAVSAPIDLGARRVTVSASIGIATGNADQSCTALLRNADIAMYRAKATGKGRIVRYEPQMRVQAVERVRLENDLHTALERDEFFLLYQPVVDLHSGGTVGFEALLRWQHPVLGLIEPDRFIPLAEETGVIVPIGAWVLTEACRTAAEWSRTAPRRRLSMAVNISGRQLASPGLVGHVAAALRVSGFDPGLLVLEMTETSLVQDPDAAAARLHELRALGIRLAVDDFGTGYSSLAYLRQFPVDILKIDRSFIETISEVGQIPAIVRALLDLSRTLGLQTVAEGIELDLQRDQLRDESCELGQGYLFARPMSATEAEAMLLDEDALGPLPTPTG